MAEEVIWTTEEDIRAEREQLRRWREDEDRFWTYLRRYSTNRRYNERSLARYQHEFETLRTKGWANLTGFQRERYLRLRDVLIPASEARVRSWTAEVDRIVKDIYAIRDKIAIEEERLHKKKVKPIEKEEYVGIEGCSGMNIYFHTEEEIYVVRHPETKSLIRTDKKLCIELTASIKTEGGHDPITCEITVTTYVEKESASGLISVEKAMEEGLMNWLRDEGWANLLHAFEKIGISYNTQKHVDEVGLYPYNVPDFPTAHVFMERKSRNIKLRSYEGNFKVD
jgi:hypothetical protein